MALHNVHDACHALGLENSARVLAESPLNGCTLHADGDSVLCHRLLASGDVFSDRVGLDGMASQEPRDTAAMDEDEDDAGDNDVDLATPLRRRSSSGPVRRFSVPLDPSEDVTGYKYTGPELATWHKWVEAAALEAADEEETDGKGADFQLGGNDEEEDDGGDDEGTGRGGQGSRSDPRDGMFCVWCRNPWRQMRNQ